jgi:hypothetical protein
MARMGEKKGEVASVKVLNFPYGEVHRENFSEKHLERRIPTTLQLLCI